MGIAPGLNTHQKKEQSGAPFAAGAANNGLSVDALTGKIVLGDNSITDIGKFLDDRYLNQEGKSLWLSYANGFPYLLFQTTDSDPTNVLGIYFIGRQFETGNSAYVYIRDNSVQSGGLRDYPTVQISSNQTPTTNDVSGAPYDLQLDGGFNPNGTDRSYTVAAITKGVVDLAGWTGIFKAFDFDPIPTGVDYSDTRIIAYSNRCGNNTFNAGTAAERGGSGFNGIITPTARVHIGAGDGVAGHGQLKMDGGAILVAPEAGVIETNGTNLFYTDATATRYTLAKILTASAVLDFPNTAANGQSDLTVNVPGAALNDVVAIGAPAASVAVGTWWGFVSAVNTVTVRFHNTSGGAVDPASGTFKISVTKF